VPTIVDGHYPRATPPHYRRSLPPVQAPATGGLPYDSDGLRRFLLERDTVPVIPNNPTRKRLHPFDKTAYRQRNLIERMFCRLKDWRRIGTRYDKLAANFAAAVMLAAVIIWWTWLSRELRARSD
jgi:putative transposase